MNDIYDSVLLVHYLYWELRRLKGSAEDFQQMFEEVATRSKDRFIRVRPYGHFGDRKCDGLYWGDGTAYQVYSPDEIKQAATRRKIEEDLAGAVEHWGADLKRWVFVFNVRRGLSATVVQLLLDKKKQYPQVAIEPMSNDDLWKMACELTVQDRVEILGPPPGYEGLFPISAALPGAIRERLRDGRFVIVQDILSPINVLDAMEALKPNQALGPPLFVQPPAYVGAWELAARHQETLVNDAVASSREKLPLFAVFSLSPIPLVVHLGYLLSDRVKVEAFQFHRDRGTWSWDERVADTEAHFVVDGVPEEPIDQPVEAAIRISLSARIRGEDTIAAVGALPIEVDVTVPQPDVGWLVSRSQLVEFGRVVRRVLADLRVVAPNLQRIHCFCAAPTGACIAVGQAINPRMNPPVALYEYDRRRNPRYEHVFDLRIALESRRRNIAPPCRAPELMAQCPYPARHPDPAA